MAFLLLGILPLSYGYAIIRHRLIEIDKHVNRGATYILVYSSLGGFYLLLYATTHLWLPASWLDEPFINTMLALVLATVFLPLSQRIQRLVDTIFYGSWYDYRSAVMHISQGLEQITELSSLGETISERLVRTLRLENACVFLRDLDGYFSVISAAPRTKIGGRARMSFSALPKSSLTYLLKLGAVERNSLRKALAEVTLSHEERQLLDSEQVNLWVPIIGHGQVLGLLALGQKYAGDIFSGEDLDILRVVARQASPLIENIHLVTRLKRHAADLEKRVAARTEELYAAKERVEAILASVGDGVVVTGLDWMVISVNDAFETQSGYAADEIIGQEIWNFLNHQETHGLLDKIKTSLEQGEVWSGELSNRCKDGELYDVQLTIAPVRDHNRETVGYVGSQRDITRQKELDRLKDRLIFDVSHELRTPVTNLNLYLELMERGKPEKQAGYLAVLKEETSRLIELIENILDLSRLDMWKSKKVELTAVDINAVAEQVFAAHLPLAESSGLALFYQPGPRLGPVLGEQNQLARLVTNLLSNAIRYTPEGQIYLRTFQSNGHVCLQVRDTGIGIEPEDLPNIFDRFYRGRQVSQSKITGTGLGLSIVKEIVEIHEGCIDVESEVCNGTTFSVWLPAKPIQQ
jgi:two-component system phosphate regulon sensor histidine kinase PhoR